MSVQAAGVAVAPSAGADEQDVNPHYLDHVVASAAEHELEASEDIVSGSGVKLLAKGARIGAGMRERLLQHKLAKPLESCLATRDGVTPQALQAQAEALLEQHEMLRALCSREQGEPLPQVLGRLQLAPPVQALLTVYADQQGGRMGHAVGVTLLALALARRLLPGAAASQQELVLAGLLHDVGELYIDPACLDRETVLQPEQWRHIVSHPVIGHRVLAKLQGAGPMVAELVLNHHERLDGFGYPRGIADEQFALQAQLLAAAEWLMGLIEAGAGPLARATVAAKLMPGEFNAALLDLVYAAARGTKEMVQWLEAQQPLQQQAPQVRSIVATLQRFRALQAWAQAQLDRAGPELRSLLQKCLGRLQRIQASFSSAGLDAAEPERVLAELAAQQDPLLHQEVQALIGEFGWRMRELERECLLRASLLSQADRAVMLALMDRLSGVAAGAPAS